MYKRYLSKIGGVLRISWDGVAVLKDQKENDSVELKIDLLRNGNILKVDDDARGSIALLIQENGGRCLVAVLQLLEKKLKMVSRNIFMEDIFDMLIFNCNELLLVERDKVIEFNFKRKNIIRKISLLQAYLPRSIFQGQVIKSVTHRNSADTFVNFFLTSEKCYLRLFNLNSPSCSFIAQLHSKVSQLVVLKTNLFVVSIEVNNQIAVLCYKQTERQLETYYVLKLRSVGVLQNIKNHRLVNRNKQQQLQQCSRMSYSQNLLQQDSNIISQGNEVILLANYNEKHQQVDFLEVRVPAENGFMYQHQLKPGGTVASNITQTVDIKIQRVVELTASSVAQNVLICDENQSAFDCIHSRANSNQFVEIYIPAKLRPKSNYFQNGILPLKDITNKY